MPAASCYATDAGGTHGGKGWQREEGQRGGNAAEAPVKARMMLSLGVLDRATPACMEQGQTAGHDRCLLL